MPRTKGAQADQWWADAIRRVAAYEDMLDGEKVKRLTKVAHKLFDLAEGGDVSAIKEIGDRLDGRPRQAIDTTLTAEVNHKHEQVKSDADDVKSRIAGLAARSGAGADSQRLN